MNPFNDTSDGISAEIASCIQRVLENDVGTGNAITASIIPSVAMLRGHILARQSVLLVNK